MRLEAQILLIRVFMFDLSACSCWLWSLTPLYRLMGWSALGLWVSPPTWELSFKRQTKENAKYTFIFWVFLKTPFRLGERNAAWDVLMRWNYRKPLIKIIKDWGGILTDSSQANYWGIEILLPSWWQQYIPGTPIHIITTPSGMFKISQVHENIEKSI